MKLSSNSFADGAAIPSEFAFGRYDAASHVALCDNKNPHLAFADVPAGTKSLVVIACDPDVPSSGESVNKEGMTVPLALPRVDFYHWVLIDLPPGTNEIAAGEFATGITARGKDGPGAPRGSRQGLNDYTGWFSGDADMEGQYFGYDGPCPPWNDERLHHYVFTVYAVDVERLAVDGAFTGADTLAALEGHVLAKASLTGTYHIYPDAKQA
jgi:Raf kinase inhibitor-like YbhB/YbcL family protein